MMCYKQATKAAWRLEVQVVWSQPKTVESFMRSHLVMPETFCKYILFSVKNIKKDIYLLKRLRSLLKQRVSVHQDNNLRHFSKKTQERLRNYLWKLFFASPAGVCSRVQNHGLWWDVRNVCALIQYAPRPTWLRLRVFVSKNGKDFQRNSVLWRLPKMQSILKKMIIIIIECVSKLNIYSIVKGESSEMVCGKVINN